MFVFVSERSLNFIDSQR